MNQLINKRALDVKASDVIPRKNYFVDDYKTMLKDGMRTLPGGDEPLHTFSFLDYDNLELAINTMLINVVYNYTINVGDTFLFLTELKGDINDTEFILEADATGLFVKDILTCDEAESGHEHMWTFDPHSRRVKL